MTRKRHNFEGIDSTSTATGDSASENWSKPTTDRIPSEEQVRRVRDDYLAQAVDYVRSDRLEAADECVAAARRLEEKYLDAYSLLNSGVQRR